MSVMTATKKAALLARIITSPEVSDTTAVAAQETAILAAIASIQTDTTAILADTTITSEADVMGWTDAQWATLRANAAAASTAADLATLQTDIDAIGVDTTAIAAADVIGWTDAQWATLRAAASASATAADLATMQTDVDAILVDTTAIEVDTTAIAGADVMGWTDTEWTQVQTDSDTAATEATEAAKHFHSSETWIGRAASPDGELHVADADGMLPFVMDAGDNTWGTWLQVSGSTDTPYRANMTKIDVHRIVITDVERDKAITRIQLAGGATGAAGLEAGTYTDIMVTPEKNAKQSPLETRMPRFDAGTKGWARCWVTGQDTGTVNFFLGVHEYLE